MAIIYKSVLKPLADFCAALLLFLILLPLFIILTLILSISLRGNPFFTQKRPGKHGRIFKIIKFKTMKNLYDEKGELLSDALRITSLGKGMRTLSLDEIPQLLNVIKGDMSFIGPRPLMPAYLALYNEEQAKRHDVKPGISGWAQVNGRNAISWKDKFILDTWYVKHQSFFLDLKILWRTAIKVIARDGISSEGQVTTKRFTGN